LLLEANDSFIFFRSCGVAFCIEREFLLGCLIFQLVASDLLQENEK
jgi:hypothetical protein